MANEGGSKRKQNKKPAKPRAAIVAVERALTVIGKAVDDGVLPAMPSEAARFNAVTGEAPFEACVCGHAREEHGNDPEYPGSTSCGECGGDCIAYESEG